MPLSSPFSSVSRAGTAFAQPLEAHFGRVLILKRDRLYGEALRYSVQEQFPAAAVQVTGCIRDARTFLANSRVDLLLLGADPADGEALELLTFASFRARRFSRVLVVTARKEDDFLAQLRALPIDGVLDPATEGIESFGEALRALAAGRSRWSQSVLERLRESGAMSGSICWRTARLPAKRSLIFAAGEKSGAVHLNEGSPA